MTKTLIEIEKDALQLPQQDRAKLAQQLLETLDHKNDEDVEELWLAEAEKRYQAYREGKIKAKPASEVFEKARKNLK